MWHNLSIHDIWEWILFIRDQITLPISKINHPWMKSGIKASPLFRLWTPHPTTPQTHSHYTHCSLPIFFFFFASVALGIFAMLTFWSDLYPHITDQECGIATSESTYLKQDLSVANIRPKSVLSWQIIQPGMTRCTRSISVWQDLGGEFSCNITKNQQMLLSTLASSGQIIPWQPAAATLMVVFLILCVLNYVQWMARLRV